MTRIRIKRVYEPAAPDDGCRVLVDKLWPRGVRKDALHYDMWAKEITPSPELRAWYHADPQTRWPEFRRRYLEELRGSQAVREFVRRIAGNETVTLLYFPCELFFVWQSLFGDGRVPGAAAENKKSPSVRGACTVRQT